MIIKIFNIKSIISLLGIILISFTCFSEPNSGTELKITNGHRGKSYLQPDVLKQLGIDVPDFTKYTTRVIDFVYKDLLEQLSKVSKSFRYTVYGNEIIFWTKEANICDSNPIVQQEYEVFRIKYYSRKLLSSNQNINLNLKTKEKYILNETLEYYICGSSDYFLKEVITQKGSEVIGLTESEILLGHRKIEFNGKLNYKSFEIFNPENQNLVKIESKIISSEKMDNSDPNKKSNQNVNNDANRNKTDIVLNDESENIGVQDSNMRYLTDVSIQNIKVFSIYKTKNKADIEILKLMVPDFQFSGNIGFMFGWNWGADDVPDLQILKTKSGYIYLNGMEKVSFDTFEEKTRSRINLSVGLPAMVLKNYTIKIPLGTPVPVQNLIKDQLEELKRLQQTNSDAKRQEYLINELLKAVNNGQIHDFR